MLNLPSKYFNLKFRQTSRSPRFEGRGERLLLPQQRRVGGRTRSGGTRRSEDSRRRLGRSPRTGDPVVLLRRPEVRSARKHQDGWLDGFMGGWMGGWMGLWVGGWMFGSGVKINCKRATDFCL